MPRSLVTGIFGLAAIILLSTASASTQQAAPCLRPCAYEVLVAAEVRTSEVTTKYSVVIPRALVGWVREPRLAARAEAITARGESRAPGRMKASVDFHPTYSECAPWRKNYDVRAHLELDGYRIFYEPRQPPPGTGPKLYGGFGLGIAPPNELAPGKRCEEVGDGAQGIGWATYDGHLGRKLNPEVTINLRLGEGSSFSGAESLSTSWELTYGKKRPITRLGFPLDRLWLGKGFKVTYQLRDASPPNGYVRIEFLPRKR